MHFREVLDVGNGHSNKICRNAPVAQSCEIASEPVWDTRFSRPALESIACHFYLRFGATWAVLGLLLGVPTELIVLI